MESSAFVLLSSNTFIMTMTCGFVATIVLLIEFAGIVWKPKSSEKTSTGPDASALSEYQRPPGPKPYPIIGNLACLDGYEVPYQAFGVLAKRFGPIISLQLGSVPSVVVNGIDNIKEVLITKSSHFDSRPNFRRYHDLFSGNKQNCKCVLLILHVFICSLLVFALSLILARLDDVARSCCEWNESRIVLTNMRFILDFHLYSICSIGLL